MLDLRRYLKIVEFLQGRQQRAEEGRGADYAPSWLDVTNDWARDELGLDDDQREYFVAGVNILAGNFTKAGHWTDLVESRELDEEVWLFYRAWVDHYGPLYPPRQR